ncbi:MAG: nucleotidyl transferase AbiEii/AbiGii toxin family protein [Verrucomicrobiota bacterium]
MNPEPRQHEDYSDRQVEAAHRVLVDLGQVLASFSDCIVLVGGWVPDLLLPDADEPHVGSIDVDLALDAEKLNGGRYAELLKLLLDTRRYVRGVKDFQLVAEVDLGDGGTVIQVEVEFLAPKDVSLKRNRTKLIKDFRVLQADGCGVAFHAPVEMPVPGINVRGAKNTVRLRIASLADFLVMKAHAIAGRDKPKDSYDFCYCLDHVPGGLGVLAEDWKARLADKDVSRAVGIIREKFEDPASFGPQQVVEFYHSQQPEEQAMQARRAFELVREFLKQIDDA